jgi:hypothetical protein
MPETPQTYKNHVRFFPPFHFFVAPVLMLNVLYTAWRLYQTPSIAAGWAVVVAAALLMLALVARVMALTVQDRVIRMEMRLRLREALPPDLLPRIPELTRQQMVALRFASDAELPALVRDVVEGRAATQKAIKERVQNWQADYLRC